MEMLPQITAYFEAKDGNFDAIDNYFTDDILIEDTGENDTIKGFDNCKKWLKGTSGNSTQREEDMINYNHETTWIF